MCITELGFKQKGIITNINTSDPHVQRLMTMGLVEGAEIEHLTSTGNAYEFKIMNSVIAFSKEQAQHFTVEPV
jgi:Fe2+ transport system protein FeoA